MFPFPCYRNSKLLSLQIFFLPFSLSSLSGTLIMRMLVHLTLPQRSLSLSLFLFILFSLFCSAAVVSTILSSRSFICSASVILLLIPSSGLFVSVYLVFISSRSLVITSCIFSTFASILFPRSWIIFTILILNFFFLESFLSPLNLVVFLGFYLVPSSRT